MMVATVTAALFLGQLATPTTIQTPAGVFPTACVHQMPDGAAASGSTATLNGKVVATFEDCSLPHPQHHFDSASDGGTAGWAENTYFSESSPNYVGIFSELTVPDLPPSGSPCTYFFNAMQAPSPSGGDDIIQPLLSYNCGWQGDSSAWVIVSFYLGWLNHASNWGVYYTTPVKVNPGDLIYMEIAPSSQYSPDEGYYVIDYDDTTGGDASGGFNAIHNPQYYPWDQAFPAVLELPSGISTCSQLPPNNMDIFAGNAVYDQCGTWPSFCWILGGSWGTTVYGLTPSCGYQPLVGYVGSSGTNENSVLGWAQ